MKEKLTSVSIRRYYESTLKLRFFLKTRTFGKLTIWHFKINTQIYKTKAEKSF